MSRHGMILLLVACGHLTEAKGAESSADGLVANGDLTPDEEPVYVRNAGRGLLFAIATGNNASGATPTANEISANHLGNEIGPNIDSTGGATNAILDAADGAMSTTMHTFTTDAGEASPATGVSNTASGSASTTTGDNTTAQGSATTMGILANATGDFSLAAGAGTVASGHYSFATGGITNASGDFSVATGLDTEASGAFSTAMGYDNTAAGAASTAIGMFTTASGDASTTMGANTTASGYISTAMGDSTAASGRSSTAMGEHTVAQSVTELTMGRYNEVSMTPNPTEWDATDAILRVGNGTPTNRSDALRVMKSGITQIKALEAATLVVGGIDVLLILVRMQTELAEHTALLQLLQSTLAGHTEKLVYHEAAIDEVFS